MNQELRDNLKLPWRELLGSRVTVFDSLAWAQAGYDQPDGNAQFYRPATVERVLITPTGEVVADVRWDHNNRVSAGHFIDAMTPGPHSKLPRRA